MSRQNPQAKPIDFGPVVTSGACRLTVKDNVLSLTLLPGKPNMKFNVRLRWADLPWKLPTPAAVEAVAEDGHVLDRQPVHTDGDTIVLNCESKVFGYRFVNP